MELELNRICVAFQVGMELKIGAFEEVIRRNEIVRR